MALLNILGLALTGVLVYFGAALVRGAAGGAVAAALWMTYPLNLYFLTYPNPEAPFEVFLFSALLLFWWALVRKQRPWLLLLACGVLLGCSMARYSVPSMALLFLLAPALLMRRAGKPPLRDLQPADVCLAEAEGPLHG